METKRHQGILSTNNVYTIFTQNEHTNFYNVYKRHQGTQNQDTNFPNPIVNFYSPTKMTPSSDRTKPTTSHSIQSLPATKHNLPEHEEKRNFKCTHKQISDLPENNRIGSLSRRLFGLNGHRRWNQCSPL